MARQRRRRVYRQEQATPPPSIDRGERLERCLDLRRAGLSYAEIGKEVGLSGNHVYRIINSEMIKRRERYAEKADQLIQMQLDRLEWLWNKMQGQMEQGSPRAVEVGISLLKRQAELLGLDKPIKIHNTHELIELSDDELRQEAERLRVNVQNLDIPQLLPGETTASVPQEIIDAEIVPPALPHIPASEPPPPEPSGVPEFTPPPADPALPSTPASE